MSPDKGPEQHVRDSPVDHHGAGATSTSSEQVARSHGHSREYIDRQGSRYWDPSNVDNDRRSRHDESNWRRNRSQRNHAYDSHSDRPQRAYDSQRSRQYYTNSSRRDTG
ncbi:hypothetical protein GGI21_003779, partial [Coemansia aciculifera]